jgi:2-polyprenyl-6-methoxyphenol hydroxylase-like FAD-dependent oxidoreductase
MHTVIVGAGPTGLFTAIALARRGHQVTVIDRDSGPRPDNVWQRKGVMQFHHPHGFRQQVVEALAAEMPDVVDALLGAGAELATPPDQPGRLLGLRCRRLTFERVLRSGAEAEPGVSLRVGHVEDVIFAGGRAVGVRVDGRHVGADLFVDASGRAVRLARALRAPAEGGHCGIAYVSRQYQLLPGAELGPMNAPIGTVATYVGYQVIVFLHDNRTFSTLFVRASTDQRLAGLRSADVFDAVTRVVPALAAWTDPDRAQPITPVLPGGRLYNHYQGQLNKSGRVALPGLIFVGDAVCTTNPAFGRGVATSLMQAQHLLSLLDSKYHDLAALSYAFDRWCVENIKPWFLDHLQADRDRIRRWSGDDVDLSRPLPSDLIVAAAEVDPSMFQVVGPYLTMHALPASLASIEPRAREIYAGGWRPPIPDGPTRDDLADLAASASCRDEARPGRRRRLASA